MREHAIFPYDEDTLWLINQVEEHLGIENIDVDKMEDNEYIEYIDQITLMLLETNHDK